MDINLLIRSLDWDTPAEIKEAAMKELEKLDEDNLSVLLQPNGKGCWENAAILLRTIGYPRIRKILPGLFEWLQDVNWPGADIVIEILANINKKDILPHIEHTLIEAAKKNDEPWINGINYLVNAMKLTESDFSSKEIYEILDLVK